VIASAVRMEGCSPAVALHTGGAQDHVYEVAWASQGYTVGIEYAPTATRVGSVVRALHQAAGHREAAREVASVPNLRAAAFRFSNTETGFDRLACLSGSVSGVPSRLADFALPGQDGYQLTGRGVLVAPGRGLAFLADARACKEFALAVDADGPRLVVQCFDIGMNLLTEASGSLVRASGMSMQWSPGARWWQGSADLDDAALTRLQVVRLAEPVFYALIGIAGIGAAYEARAMRLACHPSQSPAALWGLPDLPFGTRRLATDLPWDPPEIAAGGTAQVNVPLPGARPGDFAGAAWSAATSGAVFLAQVGATDVVTVTAYNRTAAALDLNPGTVRARVVKA
jgi:hypothetical protein